MLLTQAGIVCWRDWDVVWIVCKMLVYKWSYRLDEMRGISLGFFSAQM